MEKVYKSNESAKTIKNESWEPKGGGGGGGGGDDREKSEKEMVNGKDEREEVNGEREEALKVVDKPDVGKGKKERKKRKERKERKERKGRGDRDAGIAKKEDREKRESRRGNCELGCRLHRLDRRRWLARWWLESYLNHPMTLMELSRISIRRHLGFSLAERKCHPDWDLFPTSLTNFIFLQTDEIF